LRNSGGGAIRSSYVTDIFMTPGWQRSKGAIAEHRIAKTKKIKIHYLETAII